MNQALIVLAVAAMAMATATTPCRAQTQPAYPSHPIRIDAGLIGGAPDAFAKLIHAETERWLTLIRRLGLKGE